MRAERLIADRQHGVIEKRPVQAFLRRRIDRLAQVNAVDFGAGMARQRSDRERISSLHGASPDGRHAARI